MTYDTNVPYFSLFFHKENFVKITFVTIIAASEKQTPEVREVECQFAVAFTVVFADYVIEIAIFGAVNGLAVAMVVSFGNFANEPYIRNYGSHWVPVGCLGGQKHSG